MSTPPTTRRRHPDAPDPEETLLAWHALLRVSSRVIREFDRRFDLEHRVSAREFDVLINLGNAAEGRLRMTDLAAVTMLSSGGLTRLVGRLEQRGLVGRVQDPSDARAFLAGLTDEGRAVLAAMRTTHDSVVRDLFGARLSAADVAVLGEVLGRVLGEDGDGGVDGHAV
jgi:DNA-binding MarR family transcriptional regulator